MKFSNKINKFFEKFLEGKSSINDILWLYKNISKRNKLRLVKLIFLMGASALSEVLSVSAFAPFLSLLVDPETNVNFLIFDNYRGFLGINNPLIAVAVLLILLNILTPLLKLYSLKKGGIISAVISSELSYKLFKTNLNQPYSEYINENSSSLISASSVDIARVFLILNSFNSMTMGFLIMILIILNLFILNFKVAFFSFIIISISYLIIGNFTKNRLFRNSKIVSEGSKKQVNIIQDIFGSIKEVILYKAQKLYLKNYFDTDKIIRLLGAENIFLSSFPKFILEAIGIVCLVILAIYLYLNNLTISTILPFIGVLAVSIQRILPAFQQLYAGWSLVKGNQAHLKRVRYLTSKKTLNFIDSKKLRNYKFRKEIIFKNVSFKYESDKKVLFENINIKISKGEKIGLVGSTGSGKSTFINILMGFLSPTVGDILIDNNKINFSDQFHNLKKWQNNISYVPQEIYLKDASIMENIAFSDDKENIDKNKIISTAKKALILDFIKNTPKKFETIVGERGNLLSGGQIQRIGIARALYRGTNVLILDEATSALDLNTEKNIINSILSQNDNLTIFMIAHRLSVLKDCDRIFYFNNKQIEEMTYKEMIQKMKF